MRFDASQHMRLGQQMKLAPQMIQSMEILQMSLAELQERIDRELESNATLEAADAEPDALDADASRGLAPDADISPETGPLRVDETNNNRDDFERLDSYEQANPEAAENVFEDSKRRDEPFERPRADDGERDAKMDAMANTAERVASIGDQLRDQWRMSEVVSPLRDLGELIIAYIEDDGYLRTALDAIADRAAPLALDGPSAPARRPTRAELERALQAVQLLLEPPGVGARDLRECLLLQIDARQDDTLAETNAPDATPDTGKDVSRAQSDAADAAKDIARRADDDWSMVRRIVEHHLDDLGNNRLPRIAQKLGVSVEDVKRGLTLMRTLSFAPGRRLDRATEPPIVPDAFVEYDPEGDRYVAYLNDRRLPNLRINQQYALMSKDRSVAKPTRDFIRTNLANASFLLDAIEQRQRTVLRVVEAVVAAQREYFDYGPQALRPLPMTKVAEQLGIHVATVSRAVADKYLATPRGVVALRKFFTGGTTSDAGEEVSWDAIKAALQDVIDAEDKKNPLSDDQLADELKKRGLDIARRTVAKYRGQLGIPTGRLRKAH
jgi:RNA polymerase sigma-54 factor